MASDEKDIGADNSKWSPSEDGHIIKLKLDGETWAGIGGAIGRGKNDVKKRFKHLSERVEKLGLSLEDVAAKWAESHEAAGGEILESPDKKKDKGKGKEVAVAEAEAEVAEAEAAAAKAKAEAAVAKAKVAEAVQAKDDDEGDAGKKSKGKKGKEKEAPAEANDEEVDDKKGKIKEKHKKEKKKQVTYESSSGSATPSSSSSEDSSSEDEEEERKQQKHHIYHEVYGTLYPSSRERALEPDDFWSETDCRILTIIEAKHEALKWKYMQAEFFNATGRMVSVDLLKYKMNPDEESD